MADDDHLSTGSRELRVDDPGEPIALEAFETLAESYARLVDTKPHNAYYERPATLSLMPEVRGKRVLDAGCGPGAYAEWLADRGARVVAFDVSPTMVRLAKQRLGEKAEIIRADLNGGLSFLNSESFDVVLSALTLDYVLDWDQVFCEFHRVLRAPGHLVFSISHPLADFLTYQTKKYFEVESVSYTWRGFGEPVVVPSYRRPLSAALSPLIEAGFALERIIEPQPTEEFRFADPEHYAKLMSQPGFLCVRAVKDHS